MSPKQEIYRERLRTVLPSLRNAGSVSLCRRVLDWRRWGDKSAYEDADLIHNLCFYLYEEEFGDHDLWILNHQARSCCESTYRSLSYPRLVDLIRELFALVPEFQA